jgi:hypothetical protein
MRGFEGVRSAKGVPCSDSGVRGVDARWEIVSHVIVGVRWMCCLIAACAVWTDARVRGGQDDTSPILEGI